MIILKKALVLPKRHTDDGRVFIYLTDKRGIDPEIVRAFIQAGDIYESRYVHEGSGRVFTNAVFVGRDEDGAIRQASVRGIDSGFKGEASGSDKNYSFSAGQDNDGDSVHVYESAIDLLSYLTLLKKYGKPPFEDWHISLSGIYQPGRDSKRQHIPLSLGRFLMAHPETRKAVLHLDNDVAGRLAANAIMSSLSQRGINVVDAPPGTEKDVNDYLQSERRRERGNCR